MFQFPSNGKVYCKLELLKWQRITQWKCFNSLQTGKCIAREIEDVGSELTVGFPFPSNGKVYCKSPNPLKQQKRKSFNSLQTGTCIARGHSVERPQVRTGFNSLQTGKCIASWASLFFGEREGNVSIPFKRESVLQVTLAAAFVPTTPRSFNSLQTGKCIAREQRYTNLTVAREFQFPSNGKVYCKRR